MFKYLHEAAIWKTNQSGGWHKAFANLCLPENLSDFSNGAQRLTAAEPSSKSLTHPLGVT